MPLSRRYGVLTWRTSPNVRHVFRPAATFHAINRPFTPGVGIACNAPTCGYPDWRFTDFIATAIWRTSCYRKKSQRSGMHPIIDVEAVVLDDTDLQPTSRPTAKPASGFTGKFHPKPTTGLAETLRDLAAKHMPAGLDIGGLSDGLGGGFGGLNGIPGLRPVSEPLRRGCTRTAPSLHTPPQPQLPGPAVTPAAARGVARCRGWLPGLGHVDDGGRRHLPLLDPELVMRCQDGRLFEHAPAVRRSQAATPSRRSSRAPPRTTGASSRPRSRGWPHRRR